MRAWAIAVLFVIMLALAGCIFFPNGLPTPGSVTAAPAPAPAPLAKPAPKPPAPKPAAKPNLTADEMINVTFANCSNKTVQSRNLTECGGAIPCNLLVYSCNYSNMSVKNTTYCTCKNVPYKSTNSLDCKGKAPCTLQRLVCTDCLNVTNVTCNFSNVTYTSNDKKECKNKVPCNIMKNYSSCVNYVPPPPPLCNDSGVAKCIIANLSYCNLTSKIVCPNMSALACGGYNSTVCTLKNTTMCAMNVTDLCAGQLTSWRLDNPHLASNASAFRCNLTNVVLCNITPISYKKPVVVEPPKLELLFFDVGFADATFVRQGNFTMLIDSGTEESSTTVIDALKTMGITKLDAVLLTGWDSGKIGGLRGVLEKFSVYGLWHNGNSPFNPTMVEILKDVSTYEVPEEKVFRGFNYSYGNLSIQVYNPAKEQYSGNQNLNSVVFSLKFSNFCAFFPGDVEQEIAPTIIGSNSIPQCALYKWEYHGRGRPLPSQIYDAVRPSAVVVSTGYNTEGLPSYTTLSRINISGAKLYRTDLDKNVYLVAYENGTYNFVRNVNISRIGSGLPLANLTMGHIDK